MNEADVLHYEQIQDMLLTDGWKNVHKEISILTDAIEAVSYTHLTLPTKRIV